MRHCLLLLFLAASPVWAQEFQMRQYRVADGLPSDVVKAVAQDTLGYFWIATDDGLVKFDGLRFTPYKSALHSQYAKGFLKTRNGRLLHFGDLDLIEIQNRIDTVIFKSIRQGGRNPTDTMLWYPKTLFEDRQGDIWVAEPQSVVRLHGNDLMRFDLSMRERSPQFLRSFSFFEDTAGVLHIVSYFGRVYRFNGSTHVFEATDVVLPTDVSAVLKIDDQLWVASHDGLYSCELGLAGAISNITKRYPLTDATDIKLCNNELVVTSAGNAQIIFDPTTDRVRKLPIEDANTNKVYVSDEQDLWFASTEALILLQKNLFKKAGADNTFIESIAEDETNQVFFCTMRYLYSINEKEITGAPKIILDIPRGYFQSLLVTEQGLWVANGLSVLLLKNGQVTRKWNFEEGSRFIQDLMEDSEKNIWLSQSGIDHVNKLAPDFTVTRYPIPLLPEGSINAVREGPEGLYVLANGLKGHLFFKARNSDKFVNISLPVDFKSQSDFNVTDLAVNRDMIWLASSEGLLRIRNGKMTRVDLGEQFTKLSVKNIKTLQDGQLLFTNSFGLIRYEIETGDFWLYDESNGLASNSITTRGIFVDDHRHVWVGTSKGLSYSLDPIIADKQTLMPYVTEARVNGSPTKFTSKWQVPFKAFVELDISSITFPQNNIIYQYREPGRDTLWHTVKQNIITLSNLMAGDHVLEIRARKNGGLAWSDMRTVRLTVLKPIWQKVWFVLFVFLVLSVIAWGSFATAAKINQKRRAHLQSVIDQRTGELRKTNDELTTRNTELDRFVYSASHDLSAPLKSLLGLVYVARKEVPDPAMSAYLDMMEQSVKKLEGFIHDVTNYSRNARTEVQWKAVHLKALIHSVLSDHQYTPGFNAIEFRIKVDIPMDFISDEMRLKIILNNLISNAIKFQWTEDKRKPIVMITAKQNINDVVITVTDNGRGIAANVTDKVFNMFYRGTDSIPGSGLGLYILKETVLKLGGTVQLDSEVGRGTTFTITLPKK